MKHQTVNLPTKYPPQDLKKGDRVGFARYFLRSIGTSPTSPSWSQVGTVVEVAVHGNANLCHVQWDHEPVIEPPTLIQVDNVALLGSAKWAD